MATRSRVRPSRSDEAGSRTEPVAPQPVLTDEQWGLIKDLFPHDPPSQEGGRPRIEPRACLEGILWVLLTGARWKDLPSHFPSKSTCHLRFTGWVKSGVFHRAWKRLLRKLDALKGVNWEECFGDGTFSSAKKGGNRLARRGAAKAQKSCCSSMATEFPSASILKQPTATKSVLLIDCSTAS